MKKRMLYLSHVDWNWIKQRPHFLAEELSRVYDIKVLYAFKNSARGTLQKQNDASISISPLYYVPFSGRVPILGVLADCLLRLQFRYHLKKHDPEIVFLTYPTQVKMIPENFTGAVIYDCMDNHYAMTHNANIKNNIMKWERVLLERANLVLVSSERLKGVLLERYGYNIDEKLILIRNGYSGHVLKNTDDWEEQTKKVFEIAYFGTVSHWFNFDFLLRSLDDFPNLQYKIIGPAEVVVQKVDRIEYLGTVEHEQLFSKIKNSNALIMPFVINEVIESVDPVKLYEYINFEKNIITIRYAEIERFEPFVHFYTDYDSYRTCITDLMQDNTLKYSYEQKISFLEKNTWNSRVKAIVDELERRHL